MGFFLNRSIDNVRYFALNHDEIMAVSDDALVKYGNNPIEVYRLKNTSQEVFFNVYFFVNDIYGNGVLLKNDIIINFDGFILDVLDEKNVLLIKESKTWLYDIDSQKPKIEIADKSLMFITHDNLIYRKLKKSIIACHSLKDGKTNWSFDVTEIGKFLLPGDSIIMGEILQVITVYNETLWIYLKNGKLLGLDANTGLLLFELWDTALQDIHFGDVMMFSDGGKRHKGILFHVDKANMALKGLIGRVYCEVQLNTTQPRFEFWVLQKQFEENGIKEAMKNTVITKEGNLFFFDANAHKWGLFNTYSKRVEWVSNKLEIEKNCDAFTQLKEIRCSENKVYVLDSNKRLRIYEIH